MAKEQSNSQKKIESKPKVPAGTKPATLETTEATSLALPVNNLDNLPTHRTATAYRQATVRGLQRKFGNQYVQRLLTNTNRSTQPKPLPASLRPPQIQTKLSVNEPNDSFEQEADQVAEQATKMEAPAPPPPTTNPNDNTKPNTPLQAKLNTPNILTSIQTSSTDSKSTSNGSNSANQASASKGTNSHTTPKVTPPPSRIQAKLSVNDPNDSFEKEADEVAEQVTKIEAPAPPPPPSDNPNDNNNKPASSIQAKSVTKDIGNGSNNEINSIPSKSIVTLVQGNGQNGQAPPITPAPSHVQAKLSVNDPNDSFEKEADEVAEQVTKIEAPAPPPPIDGTPSDSDGAPTPPSDPTNNNNTPNAHIQAFGEGTDGIAPETEAKISGMKGGGAPLADTERTFFEDRMGADFGDVRIHTGADAVQTSRDINAKAYTLGSDIAFNEGEYQPGSQSGRKLIAHELTHVMQQGAAGQVQPKTIQRDDDEPTEEEKAIALAKAKVAEQEAKVKHSEGERNIDDSERDTSVEEEKTEEPKSKSLKSLAEGPVKEDPEQQLKESQQSLVKEQLDTSFEKKETAKKDRQGKVDSEKGEAKSQMGGTSKAGVKKAVKKEDGGGEGEGDGPSLETATATAQMTFDTAFELSKSPPDKAPTSPDEDPGFGKVTKNVEKTGEEQRTHEPSTDKADEAQGASVNPPEEITGMARTTQVGEMEETESPPFDAVAFKAKLMERIAALTPDSVEDVDDFENDGDLGEVKGEMEGEVDQQRTESQAPLEETTGAPPDTESVTPKEVTPLTVNDPGQQPGSMATEVGVPKSKGKGEFETPLADSDAAVDKQMEDADITEEQLLNSNEPDFISSVESKKEAKKSISDAPKTYRSFEGKQLKTAESEAEKIAKEKTSSMHSERSNVMGSVDEKQEKGKTEDEKARDKVAKDINDIFNDTQSKVQAILDGIDGEVNEIFDAGAAEARQVFEDYVDRKMDAYKERRYGGWFGWAKWAKDKILGMPSEVNAFYTDGRNLYLEKMDAVIDNVVAVIGRRVTEAKAEVANGKKRIQEYVEQLPDDLKKVGEDAASDIQERFDELEESINDKQGELIDSLAQKYQKNLEELDARIEELKEANKGLVQKVIDAVAGVIETIIELKNMLLEVLAKVAHVVGQIIKDPIGFLGNLLDAIVLGFNQFVDNIWEHLKAGFVEWLVGPLGDMGVEIPTDFSLPSIFKLVMQILGLSMESVMGKVSGVLGIDVMGVYDKVMEIVTAYQDGGLAGLAKYGLEQLIGAEGVEALMSVVEIVQVLTEGDFEKLWEIIQGHLTDLKDMVFGAIQDWLITKVVQAGVTWLIGLFNPAGAFIKACKLIYDVIMFFIERGQQIMALINAIIDSVANIAAGNIAEAANYIEKTLAKFIPVALGFLSSLLGIGGITAKVRSIIEKTRKKIDKAIDKILDSKPVQMVAGFIKKAIAKVKGLVEKGKEKVLSAVGLGQENETVPEGEEQGDGKIGDGEIGETIKFSSDGESHKLWINVQGSQATVMVASDPSPVEAKLLEWDKQLTDSPEMLGEKSAEAKSLLERAKSQLGLTEKEGDEAVVEVTEAETQPDNEKAEEEAEAADREVEEAQHQLVTILKQLFEIFGEEFPTLEGKAKDKFDQVLADPFISTAIKTTFQKEVFDELLKAGTGADQLSIIKYDVVGKGDYLAKGKPIPASELEAKGAMTRVIPLQTVWNDHLPNSYTKQFKDFDNWLYALGDNLAEFQPATHLDKSTMIPGEYNTAWWAPRSQQKGNTMAELIIELSLNSARYKGGSIRTTLDAEASKLAGFVKPTPLDGIFFDEFKPAVNNVWGVTAGGSLEAVAPKIPLSSATQTEFLPADDLPQLPEGLEGEVSLKYGKAWRRAEVKGKEFGHVIFEYLAKDSVKESTVHKPFKWLAEEQGKEWQSGSGSTPLKTADELFAEVFDDLKAIIDGYNPAADWVAIFPALGKQLLKAPSGDGADVYATIGNLFEQKNLQKGSVTNRVFNGLVRTLMEDSAMQQMIQDMAQEEVDEIFKDQENVTDEAVTDKLLEIQDEIELSIEDELEKTAGRIVNKMWNTQAIAITQTQLPRNLTVRNKEKTLIRERAGKAKSNSLYTKIAEENSGKFNTAMAGEIHHLVPLYLGGTHHIDNLVSAFGAAKVAGTVHHDLHEMIDEVSSIKVYVEDVVTKNRTEVELPSLSSSKIRNTIEKSAGGFDIMIGTLHEDGNITYVPTTIKMSDGSEDDSS